jgi:hypothetical protein
MFGNVVLPVEPLVRKSCGVLWRGYTGMVAGYGYAVET